MFRSFLLFKIFFVFLHFEIYVKLKLLSIEHNYQFFLLTNLTIGYYERSNIRPHRQ